MKRHPQSDVVWNTIRDPKCKACPLHKDAQTVCLLGDGPVPCDGMIVGEAPGYREDEVEIPFSGKSGLFLRKMLKSIDLDPRQLYITNVAACRPPGNRAPTRKEAKTCGDLYLRRQLDLVRPRAVLLLGATAISYVKGRKTAVGKLEGSTFPLDQAPLLGDMFIQFHEITCVPSRHPSSVIRMEGEKEYPFLCQQFRENLLLFKRILLGTKDDFKFERKPIEFNEEVPYVYTDLETDGLNPFRPESKIHITGFSQPGALTAFPLEKKFHSYVKETLKKYPIIAHRATFEGMWYREKFGITPRIYHDTKLCAYLIDENEPSGLKYQAIRYLGVEPWSEEMDFQNPDFDKMLPYNARDNAYGLRLYRERDLSFLRRHPKVARLLRYILLPAEEVIVEMVCNGFHIDEKAAKKKLKHCEGEKEKINKQLNKIAGKEVNPGSPKQMSRLLYGKLQLTCPVMTKGGKKNAPQPSTSEAALVRLRGQHPATDLLWDWRGWDKKQSTYLEPWLRQGPILHALYDITGTDTGRLASSMVKNKRGEKGTGGVIHQCPRDPFIRNLITPRNPGWCILAADLSQVELRLVAHAANEVNMIEIFQKDPHMPEGDIHLATAMDVLKKKQSEIDKETRKKAKAVNFGFVYGMFPPKFQAYAKEKFDLDLTLQESKDYRKGFFRKYGGLLAWHRRVEAFVTENGWIDSILGRRRHLASAKPPGREDCTDCLKHGTSPDCFMCGGTGYIETGEPEEWIRREAVRQAINSPIQSAASDLDLLIAALVASYSLPWNFKIDRKRTLPIGAAHDSLLFEVERSYAPELKRGILWTVKKLPEVIFKYFGVEMRVPLIMDVAVYSNCWEGTEWKVELTRRRTRKLLKRWKI